MKVVVVVVVAVVVVVVVVARRNDDDIVSITRNKVECGCEDGCVDQTVMCIYTLSQTWHCGPCGDVLTAACLRPLSRKPENRDIYVTI